MTNTGKTLIIGLVLADLVICAYLLYPREEKKSSAPVDAVLTAPDAAESRSRESHMIAGSIVGAASPGANANNANAATDVSRVNVRPSAPAAPTVAPSPQTPAVPVAPATNMANVPATDMPPQAQPQQPQPQSQQPQQSLQVQQAQQAQAQQPQRYSAKPRTTQRADESRGHDDLRRHGSNDVGALMTELLVRESAKLDPSLPPPPPPPPTDRDQVNRRSSNPVAAAMTDQLVKESAKVAPASAAQRQQGTQ
jgi:hypothetical protein